MMLYVIPFILLLVVAIVLKKREASKKEDNTSSKTVNKKAGKKTTAKNTAKSTPAALDFPTTQQAAANQTTPLAPEIRQQIRQRIQSRNFFAAEAEINQALNRDASQHELYLLLLEIHLEQKDDFAIRQLMNQLRDLGLDDILQQAEAQQQAHQDKVRSITAAQSVETPVIAETAELSSTVKPSVQPTENRVTAASFDALVEPQSSKPSFDELQSEFSSVKNEPEPAPAAVTPLEFNFSETAVKTETAIVVDTPATIIEETKAPKAAEPVQDLSQALEFKLDTPVIESAPTAKVAEPEPENTVAEPAPLEFSFSLESANKVEASEPVIVAEAPVVEPKADSAPAETEFKLDLASFDLTTPGSSPEPTAVETPVSEAVLIPEVPTLTATPASGLEFNLDAPAISLDTAAESNVPAQPALVEQTTTLVDQHDPLTQSFPELLEVNEINLNLQLAQQYIQLGAYAQARRLLSENEAQFNPEQREQSELLLKQIAS